MQTRKKRGPTTRGLEQIKQALLSIEEIMLLYESEIGNLRQRIQSLESHNGPDTNGAAIEEGKQALKEGRVIDHATVVAAFDRIVAPNVGITLRPTRKLLNDYTVTAAERTKAKGKVVSAQEIMIEVLERGRPKVQK